MSDPRRFPVPHFYGQPNFGSDQYNESSTYPPPPPPPPVSSLCSQPPPFPPAHMSPLPPYASGPPQNSLHPNALSDSREPFRNSSASHFPYCDSQPRSYLTAPKSSTYHPGLLLTQPTYGRLDNYSLSRGNSPPPPMPVPMTNPAPNYSASFPNGSQYPQVQSSYPPEVPHGPGSHFFPPVMNHYPPPHQSPQRPYSNGAQYLHALPAPLPRSPHNTSQRSTAPQSASGMMGGMSVPADPRWSTILPTNTRYNHYSSLGKKRGLCVGINYERQERALRGAQNDAMAVHNFLIECGQYNPSDIIILNDHSHDRDMHPTYENILEQMRRLVADARPNDSFFFHFSGHGGLVKDQNRDEFLGLGKDSVIYPVDGGQIVDDTMHDIMVKPLPEGSRLTALFDACHSGTALDLPYVYKVNGKLTLPSRMDIHARVIKKSRANVVSWSSCRDSEVSADTFTGNTPVGAMSNAFIGSLRNDPVQTYEGLLESVRSILDGKDHPFQQHPQLGSSHKINTRNIFQFH